MSKIFHEIIETEGNHCIKLWDEHWYPHKDELFAGSTQIIGVDKDWQIEFAKKHGKDFNRELRRLGDIGNLAHSLFEQYEKNGFVNHYDYANEQYIDEVWQRMDRFIEFYETYIIPNFEIIGIEQITINELHKYGGTIDLNLRAKKPMYSKIETGLTKAGIELLKSYLDEHNFDIFVNQFSKTKKPKLLWDTGSKHILDWKTSATVMEHHKIQGASYAISEDADFAHIVCFPEKPTTKKGYSHSILNSSDIDEYFIKFVKLLKRFEEQDVQPLFKTLPISFERELK